MADIFESSLAAVGLLCALLSLSAGLSEVISSYKECDIELRGAVAELDTTKSRFDEAIRNLHPPSVSPRADLETLLSECRIIYSQAEQILSGLQRLSPPGSSSAICRQQVTDLEAQSLFPPIRSATMQLKLKWSFSGRSKLTKRVQLFTSLVTSFTSRVSMLRSLDMHWEDRCIWITDISEKTLSVHINECKFATDVVFHVMSTFPGGDVGDLTARRKIQNGLFWLQVEEEVGFSSKWHFGSSQVVLADNWTMSVKPGRKFRLFLSTNAKEQVNVLQETWEVVKPHLSSIMQRAGWEELQDE